MSAQTLRPVHDAVYLDEARTIIRYAATILGVNEPSERPSLNAIRRLVVEVKDRRENSFYEAQCSALFERYPQALLMPANVLAAVDYFEAKLKPMTRDKKSNVIAAALLLLDEFDVEHSRMNSWRYEAGSFSQCVSLFKRKSVLFRWTLTNIDVSRYANLNVAAYRADLIEEFAD